MEQAATRRAALENVTGHPAVGSGDRAARGLQRVGDITIRIGDGAHAGMHRVTGQVHRFPRDAKTDGHFRTQRDEINATAQRPDQPVMPLVTSIVADRPA